MILITISFGMNSISWFIIALTNAGSLINKPGSCSSGTSSALSTDLDCLAVKMMCWGTLECFSGSMVHRSNAEI